MWRGERGRENRREKLDEAWWYPHDAQRDHGHIDTTDTAARPAASGGHKKFVTDRRQTRFDTIYTGLRTNPEWRIYAPLGGFVVNAGIKIKL